VKSVTSELDGPPDEAGVPLVDFGAGLHAAYSIASLLGG
jgi:crotonobetainyl-CoA:carnitine CoA-transferase CaiB-like acyl-CoA transferase